MDAQTAPVGSWLRVTGTSRDYPSFLLNARSGRHLLTGNATEWWSVHAFSGDGRRAVWTTRSFPFTSYGLSAAELPDAGEPRAADAKISFQTAPSCLVLSADGTRLAAVEPLIQSMDRVSRPPTLTVFDLVSGHGIFSARLSSGRVWISFEGNDALRIYSAETEENDKTSALTIQRAEIALKNLATIVRIEGLEGIFFLATNSNGSRLIVHETRPRRIRLYDGSSGKPLALLAAEDLLGQRAAFLSDGRIALAEALPVTGARLRLFSADGVEEKRIELGAAAIVALAAEVQSGKLIVALRKNANSARTEATTVLVDLATGVPRSIGDHLYPAAALGWWINGDPSQRPEPGSEASKLFLTRGGWLLHLDPLVDERRVVLPRH